MPNPPTPHPLDPALLEPEDPSARLARLARQFLVHSFLYYQLNESVISDEEFDRLTEQLRSLRSATPQAPMPFGPVVDPALGPEGSGFLIRDYPPPIITAAFRLLYDHQTRLGLDIPFDEFVQRKGYRVDSVDHPLA